MVAVQQKICLVLSVFATCRCAKHQEIWTFPCTNPAAFVGRVEDSGLDDINFGSNPNKIHFATTAELPCMLRLDTGEQFIGTAKEMATTEVDSAPDGAAVPNSPTSSLVSHETL